MVKLFAQKFNLCYTVMILQHVHTHYCMPAILIPRGDVLEHDQVGIICDSLFLKRVCPGLL